MLKVSIFGVILPILVFILICKNLKNPKIGNEIFFYSVVGTLVLDIGYIAQINTFTIEYNYFFSGLNLLFAIYTLCKCKVKHNKKIVILMSCFVGYLLFSALFPLIFQQSYTSVPYRTNWDIFFGAQAPEALPVVGFSIHAILVYLRSLIFLVAFYAFSITVTKEDFMRYVKYLYWLSCVMLVIACIEFLMINIFNEKVFRNVCRFIFGNSEATHLASRSITIGKLNIFVPMCFARETSSFAKMIFIFVVNNIVFLMSSSRPHKKYIIMNIALLIVCLLLSQSLSALFYVGAIVLIGWYLIKNKKLKYTLLTGGLIMVGVFLFIMRDRLQFAFDAIDMLGQEPSSLPQRSEVIRIYSIFNNLKYFALYFLTGCGLGSIYCYSSIVTMLANIGLIGIIMYSFIVYYLNKAATQEKKFSWLTCIIIIITNLFIGHLSHLMYLEIVAFLLIDLKLIDVMSRRQVGEVKK